ncbi:hypothetical protein BH23GEM10_BH23GEM10_17910 [soil metagenome]
MSLNLDLARAFDRVAFARDCGIELDPWQADLLLSDAKRHLLLCSRQSGKSTTTGILALHEAIYAAPALILLVSPSQRQSAELFRKVIEYLHALDGAPEVTLESVLRLELANGSRIIALPGSEATTRGYSAASMVIIDEASRVPDALVAAIRPTLATSNGRLVALTTPAGKRGWFHEQWTRGEGWERTRITADDCPRISAEFLADERRELGEFMYGQEYLCEFYDAETSVFSTELIERALSADVLPLWGR